MLTPSQSCESIRSAQSLPRQATEKPASNKSQTSLDQVVEEKLIDLSPSEEEEASSALNRRCQSDCLPEGRSMEDASKMEDASSDTSKSSEGSVHCFPVCLLTRLLRHIGRKPSRFWTRLVCHILAPLFYAKKSRTSSNRRETPASRSQSSLMSTPSSTGIWFVYICRVCSLLACFFCSLGLVFPANRSA